MTMNCQKCRSPLKLDNSLEDLNPAAFDLLIGSTGKSLPENSHRLSPSRPSYPPDRKDLYDHASKANSSNSPVFKRTVPAPRHGPGSQTSPPVRGSKANQNTDMSFVMLTESQVALPPPATKVNHTSPRSSSSKLKAKRNNRSDVTVDQVQSGGDKAVSYHAEKAARLFEIISSRSDIDHPICAECTELLVDGLQKRLSVTTKERDAYIEFLRKINASIPSDEEVQQAQEALDEAQAAEAAAFEELLALEKEKATLDEEVAELEAESRDLDLEEEEFWRCRNAFALTLAEFQNERDALNMKYDHDSRQLEKLQRTNVYNDTFCIGHDGTFGTINGLRLGRLANPSVEWAEINAAWGQTCLLLATVAEKLSFPFQGYRLRPLGSSSRIDKIEYPQQPPNAAAAPPTSHAHANDNNNDNNTTTTTTTTVPPNQPPPPRSVPPPSQPKITTLDLYSSGDIPILSGMWLHRRFDAGMVAFLDCVAQLGSHVETTSSRSPNSPGLKLPYEIRKDKIGDASIKLGFNQDEIWTRACKYTLTCCKFLLAHASNLAAEAGKTPGAAGNGEGQGRRR